MKKIYHDGKKIKDVKDSDILKALKKMKNPGDISVQWEDAKAWHYVQGSRYLERYE